MGRANGPRLALALLPIFLGGCSGSIVKDSAPVRTDIDFGRIPDAVPRAEPKSRYGNPASYVVMGKRYRVRDNAEAFVQRGMASWYGTKFHGRRTSSGEVYDMYKMTAAHKTLPLPTYVEVTNLFTGRSVVVKVNDRGPFHDDRIIDLSYAAARKLKITGSGTAMVEIRALSPKDPSETGLIANAPGKTTDVGGSVRTANTGADDNSEETPPRPSVLKETAAVRPAILAAAEPQKRAEPIETASPPLRPNTPESAQASRLFLQIGAFASRGNAERLRQRLTGSVSSISIQAGAGAEQPLYRVRVGPLTSEDEAAALAARLSEVGIQSPRVIRD